MGDEERKIEQMEQEEPLSDKSAKEKRQTFANKFKAVSVDNPPSKNPIGFLSALCALCCFLPAGACALCCCCFAILYQFIPIAEIIIGAVYYGEEDCPIDSIAILLIVGGCIGVVVGAVESAAGRKKIPQKEGEAASATPENGEEPGTEEQKRDTPIFIALLANLLRIVSIVWLIWAAVVVYRSYNEVTFEKGTENYCHPLPYRFLFWIVTLSLAVLAVVPFFLCCACCAGLTAAAASST